MHSTKYPGKHTKTTTGSYANMSLEVLGEVGPKQWLCLTADWAGDPGVVADCWMWQWSRIDGEWKDFKETNILQKHTETLQFGNYQESRDFFRFECS